MATSLPERFPYRVRQFLSALNPRVTARERQEVHDQLGSALFPLFESMQMADQRHCLDVYRRLVHSGCQDGAALSAALIHDAGKGRLAGTDIRLWHRIGFVLLTPIPSILRRAARLNRGIATLSQHDNATLLFATNHDAPAAVIQLLEEMGGRRPLSDTGRLLKAADDAS